MGWQEQLIDTLVADCNESRKDILATMDDHMHPIREWPAKYVQLFLGKHIGFNDRCCLVYFLLGNGMCPTLLARWAMAQPGYLRRQKSAKHLASLIRAHGNGDFDGTTGKRVKMIWNMALKMETPCHTPTTAFDHCELRVPKLKDETRVVDGCVVGSVSIEGYEYIAPGHSYWEEAAKALEAYF